MSFRSKGPEDDWHDAYHDDPSEEKPNGKFKKNFITSLAVIAGSLIFYQNTLAANISLNLGNGIEFGQGLTQAVACSGNSKLSITPTSTFTNSSGSGSYSLSSIKVSNIPDSCFGSDFVLNVYGDTSTAAQALFNGTSTDAIIYNNSGTFEAGVGGAGMTISSGSGSFTATFTSPVAVSNNIYKVTIQSTPHAVASCAQGGACSVGDTGPGGGKIFYYLAAGFSCGPTRAVTCKYLEVAPNNWNAGTDPSRSWAQASPVNLQANISANNLSLSSAIGYGAQNTKAIIDQGNNNSASSAAALAVSYSPTIGGVNYSDWFLPSELELSEIYIRRVSIGMEFSGASYWSSTSLGNQNARYLIVTHVSATPGSFAGDVKSATFNVRPVRAF